MEDARAFNLVLIAQSAAGVCDQPSLRPAESHAQQLHSTSVTHKHKISTPRKKNKNSPNVTLSGIVGNVGIMISKEVQQSNVTHCDTVGLIIDTLKTNDQN